jgi:hypothetical protein
MAESGFQQENWIVDGIQGLRKIPEEFTNPSFPLNASRYSSRYSARQNDRQQ